MLVFSLTLRRERHAWRWARLACISPARKLRCWVLCPDGVLSRLRDAGAERGLMLLNAVLSALASLPMPRGGAESDQSDDQSILDQILTFFAALQVLELHIQLEKQIVHLCSPRFLIFPASAGGTLHIACRVPISAP